MGAARRLSAFLAVCLAATALADELRIIQLRNRPAHEVIPLVRPLLGPNDAVTGDAFRLIVRTSEKNLRQVEQLLTSIDVAPRQWTLSVRQTVVSDRTTSRYSVSGEAQVGGQTRITVTGPRSPGNSASIEAAGPNGRARAEGESVTTRTRDEHVQTLKVRDGSRAYVRVGQAVPHIKTVLTVTQRRALLAQGVELANVVTGFDVLPRAQGELVHLEITPRLSALEDPARTLVSFQELTTSVTVRPGEWLDVGQLGGTGEELRRAFAAGGATREDERQTMLIKIE